MNLIIICLLALFMFAQVDAETAGIAVAGDGGEDSMRNVMRAIEK